MTSLMAPSSDIVLKTEVLYHAVESDVVVVYYLRNGQRRMAIRTVPVDPAAVA